MLYLKKFANFLSKIECIFCGAALFVTTAINTMEIISRTLFSKSFFWVQELSVILSCWIIFIGAAYIYKNKQLLNVDFLYVKAAGRVKMIWDFFIQLSIIFVLIVLIVFGYKFQALQAISKTYVLHLPNNVYSVPLIVSACSMLIGAVIKIYDIAFCSGKEGTK